MTHHLSDEERECLIEALGRRFLAAHAAGEMEIARNWLAQQTQAVKERSEAQVARMEAEYFGSEGERARLDHQQRMVG